MSRLIGLYSPAPGSGKTAIANYLSTSGFRPVSFASTIKKMVVVLLCDLGLSEQEAKRLVYEAKQEEIPRIKTSARHLLQTLGTEYGRACVHPDVWLMCWQRRVEEHLRAGMSVICDDIRFPNEAQLVQKLGGELWLVTRPGTQYVGSHTSEGALTGYPIFNRRLVNSGTMLDLYKQVQELSGTATCTAGS